MRPHRILVTGGAGFIGGRLVRRLQEEGHSVVALDKLVPEVHGDVPSAFPNCELIRADVRDRDAVAVAMHGVDIVHHLAAETGVGQSQYEISRYVGSNTLGTAVVLEAALAARVRQVVLASSRAVYGEGPQYCLRCQEKFDGSPRHQSDMANELWGVRCPSCRAESECLPAKESDRPLPTSIYGVTKLQQEELTRCVGRTNGLPVTILRLFNVFGPGQSLRNPYVGVLGTFFRQARYGAPAELYEDGAMRRDFIYIDDAVEAFVVATGNERAFDLTINVGSGRSMQLKDVATAVFRTLSVKPRMIVSGRYRIGDVRNAVADISQLESILAYRPRTDLLHGLRSYVDWAEDNPADASDADAAAELADKGLLFQAKR